MPAYSVEEGFAMAQGPVSALMLVLCGLGTATSIRKHLNV